MVGLVNKKSNKFLWHQKFLCLCNDKVFAISFLDWKKQTDFNVNQKWVDFFSGNWLFGPKSTSSLFSELQREWIILQTQMLPFRFKISFLREIRWNHNWHLDFFLSAQQQHFLWYLSFSPIGNFIRGADCSRILD